MNEATLQAVTDEIAPILKDQKFGRVFQLARLRFVVDFRLANGKYLFISIESGEPRAYLVERKLRELEKESLNSHAFAMILRKHLANAELQTLTKDRNERILRFSFLAPDELAGAKNYTLVAQLTGRSANLFLLDDREFIIDAARENQGDGQTIATRYAAPVREGETRRRAEDEETFPKNGFQTLSEALDAHYRQRETTRAFEGRVKTAQTKIKQEIAKREKLKKNILGDLQNHGDAEKWKKFGDLLLANLATAARIEDQVLVVDYFEDDAPTLQIEVDPNLELTEAAEKFFRRYTKARNAKNELAARLAKVDEELRALERQKTELAQAIEEKDEAFLSSIVGEKPESKSNKSKEKRDDSLRGARRYASSDGWEILVGKASKDNDQLTFRIAKSLDFWLHAADYGGSHVVVRNPNRASEMPPKTLHEAAQLAAFFSQGKTQPKAAVNYTQKKHVNKPKGAAPGLVSLSSFKTILVEPQEILERIV